MGLDEDGDHIENSGKHTFFNIPLIKALKLRQIYRINLQIYTKQSRRCREQDRLTFSREDPSSHSQRATAASKSGGWYLIHEIKGYWWILVNRTAK